VALEDREVRRAMAKASLLESWRLAQADGPEEISEEEIERKICQVPKTRGRRSAGPRKAGPRKAGPRKAG